MGTLTITKAYSTGAVLTEAMIDNFRTGLHTLFNTDKFGASNFAGGMTLTSAYFNGGELLTSDDSYFEFGTDNDVWFGIDSSKNLVFDTSASSTEIRFYSGSTYYLEVYTDKLYVPGDIEIGAGNSSMTVLGALSTYKKPVLEWSSSTAVSLSCNSSSSTTTVIYFPTFVASVSETVSGSGKYREARLNVTANGYGVADSGAARGGLKSGLTLTANSWYAVYACKLRSGSDYDSTTAKFILVYDDTLPTSAYESTLNSSYGEGCWVYIGLVRYGFGATGSSSAIPKFKYSNKGWCLFYEKSTGKGGVVLATSTTDADDSSSAFFTLTSGMSGQVIPSSIGKVQLQVVRDYVSDWYAKDASGDIVWRGGWQLYENDIVHGHLVELPFFSDLTCYSFYQVRKGTGAQTKAICLTGFCDTMMTVRGQGIGI